MIITAVTITVVFLLQLMQMTNKKLKIAEIKEYERNNKDYPKEQIDLLKKMITEYGYDSPIIVNKQNVIIAGHARLKAVTELGHTEVDVIVKDKLTKKQEQKYRLLDNKISEMAKNNDDNIKIELEELQDQELNNLYKDLEITTDDEKEKETREDDVPTVGSLGIIKRGDVIKLGNHTLMCGDSTMQGDIEKLIKEKTGTITHCISDPPYGISYDNEKHGMIKNDDVILDYVGLAKKYTNGFFCMWTGHQVVDKRMELVKNHFPINNFIIWHKGLGGLGDCEKTLAQDFEIMLVSNRGNPIQGYRGAATWYRNEEERNKKIDTANKEELKDILEVINKGEVIWKVGKDGASTYLHPTQKSIEINQRAIENFTAKGDNILDLFLGSGSNLIACQKTGRVCYGMELDEHYCEVIIQRRADYMKDTDIITNNKKVNRDSLVANQDTDD